jgi:hypothetical protein
MNIFPIGRCASDGGADQARSWSAQLTAIETRFREP